MRHNQSLFDLADWLTEPPAGGPLQMWTVGAGLASIVTGYGLLCCLTQQATTLNVTLRGFQPLGRGMWVEITGVHAVTFGVVIACLGLFIHFQWFWGNHKRLFRFHAVCKYATVVALLVAIVGHVFAMITRT